MQILDTGRVADKSGICKTRMSTHQYYNRAVVHEYMHWGESLCSTRKLSSLAPQSRVSHRFAQHNSEVASFARSKYEDYKQKHENIL